MSDGSANATDLRACLDRVRAGDASALNELVLLAGKRLQFLTHRMLRDYPRVRRWTETDDVLQNALVRLCRALEQVHPPSVRDFYALATAQIRRELIDLARHFAGPENGAANHESWHAERAEPDAPDLSHEPGALADWREFHEQVAALPADAREVFGLLFYQGLTQEDAAGVLDISLRTVQRRWQAALLGLHRARNGEAPGT
ncbi:sigma-70 family RNA polymerase sigma factor [Gemmata sp. G18]|uniref:Sigma-70 family RNA polymerase sigma factor n=1 Tax=Gemmata palustris TaxID=2822762 RepID=A0ABS5BK53_9BACT|nr:sigma-70 family RNA polymerase sigma factor [Gemmata palustris]MBP3953862.1 sigma-70 family RNA polymerase sigma factor [Gemmata palustris]